MKLLFLSYHFLGPLLPLATWLAGRGHEILYASNRSSQLQTPLADGIKRVILKRYSPPPKKDSFLDILESAQVAARYAESSFLAIRDSGFVPDMVFTASSGGAALAIPSVFPESAWLNFLETPSREPCSGKDLLIPGLQISLAWRSLAFYPSQIALFPALPRKSLRLFRPVVNEQWFSGANPERWKRLAVFFNLRKAASLLREFLNASAHNTAIWITGNAQAKKTLPELRDKFPENRLQVIPEGDPGLLRAAFHRASLAFLEFPGEMLIQAMACQCAAFCHHSIPEEDLPDGTIRIPASGRELSALLDYPDNLNAYAEKCQAIVLRENSAQRILPSWFARICHNLATNKKDPSHLTGY